MVSWVLTMAKDWSRDILANTSGWVAVTMSQAISTFAPPAGTRTACRFSRLSAMRTWLTTGPPFCAKPVASNTVALRPSRLAAMPSKAPMVTTPVPPIPATIIE